MPSIKIKFTLADTEYFNLDRYIVNLYDAEKDELNTYYEPNVKDTIEYNSFDEIVGLDNYNDIEYIDCVNRSYEKHGIISIRDTDDDDEKKKMKSECVKLPENLPENLKILQCEHNELDGLPELPDRLEELYCGLNCYKEPIKSFPSTLKVLNGVWSDFIDEATELPESLIYLNCGENRLLCDCRTTPELPKKLAVLINNYNYTETIDIPDSLLVLNIDTCCFKVPPTMPDTLLYLQCGHVVFSDIKTSDIKLPAQLEYFIADSNCWDELPDYLPDSLKVIDVSCNGFRDDYIECYEGMDNLIKFIT